MKKGYSILGLGLIFAIGSFMSSCSSPQQQLSGYYDYETECMGVEMDGSQTVKSWGTGRNREDAVEQAKKNGVRDILFKGITSGRQECNQRPVIFEANAQLKYEDFFNGFFADGGAYTEYITGEDGSDLHISVLKGRSKAGDQATYGVIIRVQRAMLQDRMKSEGILK